MMSCIRKTREITFAFFSSLARRPSGRREPECDKGPTRHATQTLEQVRHAAQHAQKKLRESFDINGQLNRNYSPLQNRTQVIERYVCFAGWDRFNPDGKAEFTTDSTCPPGRDGLGWKIYRDNKRPRRTHHLRMADTFVGPCDENVRPSPLAEVAAGPRVWTPSTTRKTRRPTDPARYATTTLQTTTTCHTHASIGRRHRS